MFGSCAMQLRQTRGVFGKGCFVQYHLSEHARSDHIVKPECLFWISGPVAGHQFLMASDSVMSLDHCRVGFQSIRSISLSDGAAMIRVSLVVGPVTTGKEAVSRHVSLNFGNSSFGLLKTFGNRRIEFGQIRVSFTVSTRTGTSVRH